MDFCFLLHHPVEDGTFQSAELTHLLPQRPSADGTRLGVQPPSGLVLRLQKENVFDSM